MQLDYIIAAESAFFSEDGRISIIKIFEKINLSGGNENSIPPTINFSMAGKVSGVYGKGIRISILKKDSKVAMEEIVIGAKELNKDFFNFIVLVNGFILETEGDYTVSIKNYEGDVFIVDNKKIFSVVRS